MGKFKVGDVVRIVSVENCHWGHNEDMISMVGKEAEISEACLYGDLSHYYLDPSIDKNQWSWSDECFELVEDSDFISEDEDFISETDFLNLISPVGCHS